MALSPLPLSYCANVHPANTLEGVRQNILQYSAPLQVACRRPIAVGLWLPDAVVKEALDHRATLDGLVATLKNNGLTCYTLNAFPFGNFHAERVKEQVYLPNWAESARAKYTCQAATVLARIMDGLEIPKDVPGSLSTSPLAFCGHHPAGQDLSRYIPELLHTAEYLKTLSQRTGRLFRLGIEPEPFCVLQTTPETLEFFKTLYAAASAAGPGVEAAVRTHLGVCFDVCHQAVEFEDVATSLQAFEQAGIPIAKVHITCALELRDPADEAARAELARYIEPRYLHQTFAKSSKSQVVRQVDLDRSLTDSPATDWQECSVWRIHFHAPVNADRMGLLYTTKPNLEKALFALAELEQAPHLEVETYTWSVLPSGDRPADFSLVDGLAEEMTSTHRLLRASAPPM